MSIQLLLLSYPTKVGIQLSISITSSKVILAGGPTKFVKLQKLPIKDRYTECFLRFLKQTTKVYGVMFFDM